MVNMKIAIALILIITRSVHAIYCPSTWSVYKYVKEGSYVYITQKPNQINIFRRTN